MKNTRSILTPAEWSRHASLWIGFPSDGELWMEDLAPARAEVAALANLFIGSGQRVDLVVSTPEAEQAARALVAGAHIHVLPMGDIWLRDTGPVFRFRDGAMEAVRFRFNGWGGKYELEGDNETGAAIADVVGAPLITNDAILEGGAIDWDGHGTVLTTAQCLLNPNRNAHWTKAVAENALGDAFGFSNVVWFGDGLLNDHTDGHVDNIARFLSEGKVCCMAPFGEDDPNTDVLREIEAGLRDARDADGRPFDVVTIPSPGLVMDEDGDPIPASHMNFLIGNDVVAVPTYDTASAGEAVEALRPHFPGRTVVGLPSSHILTGGGSFHCISQQQPETPKS